MALKSANKSMVTKEINKDLWKGVQMIIENLKSSLVVWSIFDKEMGGAPSLKEVSLETMASLNMVMA
jgi:hypothetical protein